MRRIRDGIAVFFAALLILLGGVRDPFVDGGLHDDYQ